MMRDGATTALSIAGSDPSGGAGVQADLKTFSALGVYGMAALTALTAQNTRGVSAVHTPPADFVARQIDDVFADIRVDAVKIGMIANAEIGEAVAGALEASGAKRIVLDPVMIAKGGAPLLADDAVRTVASRLLPLCDVVTPNLPEAARLLGRAVAADRDAMTEQAEALRALGAGAALVKGGHLGSDDSPDCLATAEGVVWFEAPRVATRNTHGTGCTLSAALAAALAQRAENGARLSPADVVAAAEAAKRYVAGAIRAADALGVGGGHGPTHHFHAVWSAAGASR